MSKKVKIAIAGASGYAGAELVRRLHHRADLVDAGMAAALVADHDERVDVEPARANRVAHRGHLLHLQFGLMRHPYPKSHYTGVLVSQREDRLRCACGLTLRGGVGPP